jgi:AcrR family transcriptional regulator
MARPKMQRTKYEILQCATKLFLEKGYTDAYVSVIARTLQISTGNLTFWFPTKEHILAELVSELFEFQWKAEEQEQDLLLAYLFELLMIASVCEENPNIKDLIVAVYTHSMSLEIIRKYDTKRAETTFGKYCRGWTQTDYVLAENVASGIECSMLMTENTESVTFEQRVTSSLDAIMRLYEVPGDVRKSLLDEVMAMDYRGKGSHVFEEFCGYVGEKIMQSYEMR